MPTAITSVVVPVSVSLMRVILSALRNPISMPCSSYRIVLASSIRIVMPSFSYLSILFEVPVMVSVVGSAASPLLAFSLSVVSVLSMSCALFSVVDVTSLVIAGAASAFVSSALRIKGTLHIKSNKKPAETQKLHNLRRRNPYSCLFRHSRGFVIFICLLIFWVKFKLVVFHCYCFKRRIRKHFRSDPGRISTYNRHLFRCI